MEVDRYDWITGARAFAVFVPSMQNFASFDLDGKFILDSATTMSEALAASHRGTSLFFFMATAHNQFSIEKGDVKNALFQVTFEDVPPGELAAEPVPALRKALVLRDDDIVMLTKAC